MVFKVLTLFPEVILQATNFSILKRAQEKGLIKIEAINIRDFTQDKHKRTDDYPYGGGYGMVMAAQPIIDAYESIKSDKPHRVIYLTPQGKKYTQDVAKEFSKEEELVIICGHYEGIDQRVIDLIVTDEISIGDYVLSGGEYAALVLIDSISRLVEGVIEKKSVEEESFSNGLLEYPHYTRPYEFRGLKVPEILLSGNHEKIKKWRRYQSLLKTIKARPDLISAANLTKDDIEFLIKYCEGQKNVL
ncbi:tRNA (guanosine(37)-N1)-methyltransferase TrmD [Caldicellulosiruptor naganoensis]|uniref:tRNA (guanine-N(1)-)-methyltransferase n=1 Tax=Caldicellulosiruptor naganoensis TaxID=29324 RepID=A0ABY7BMC2_9FIRM|nr:tRNA (guanosine(37)-N1)-methyltransferase TrmD [Caldicellulosiruptor naganoensis]WAM32544.1 tRNA (guanosine(37)-N1)-methyltransferase TrmD [Caldicellulosiruptor naganoensis]